MRLMIGSADDFNPKWLGDMRMERIGDRIVFTVQSSRGSDKYDWALDLETFLIFSESLK